MSKPPPLAAVGIRFKGKTYSSLSAAAVAAAKDLGLAGKAMNGFVFWGLTKPPRLGADPVAALERAWERYRGVAESVAGDGVSDEKRGKVRAPSALGRMDPLLLGRMDPPDRVVVMRGV